MIPNDLRLAWATSAARQDRRRKLAAPNKRAQHCADVCLQSECDYVPGGLGRRDDDDRNHTNDRPGRCMYTDLVGAERPLRKGECLVR